MRILLWYVSAGGNGMDGAKSLQDEIAAAEPQIDEKTSQLVSKGRWMVPGYKVCIFGEDKCWMNTDKFTGEIRRPFHSIDNDLATFPMLPVLV
jgi:hypothetical protein